MLEKLELSVGSLAQYWCAKRLHDLLDRDGGAGELVLGGAVAGWRGRRKGRSKGLTTQDRTRLG